MNDFSLTNTLDTTRERLEQALRTCGLPLSLRQRSFRLEGSGAWHDAYRVTVPQHAHPYIVRLRKEDAYGQQQSYEAHADEWHAEYVSASLYYMQANRAQPGICPPVFLYHVSEELTCTVETFMGERLDLDRLSRTSAHRFGRQIGSMMRQVHAKKSHIPGSGELAWDGANLYGVAPRHQDILTRKIEEAYNENILSALTDQAPAFDHELVADKLHAAQRLRNVDEPVVLINRDVTPENLTVQKNNRVGIIDPYPYLGNGTRFAAWFLHCYRFLLPNYAGTERYRHNGYDHHADKLHIIADGFERGYIQNDRALARHIRAEQWLWALEQAYDDLERLTNPDLPPAQVIKHGEPPVVRHRLQKAIHTLETLRF